jgi:nitronate monooxygenase
MTELITRFTELMGVEYPIVSAPMALVSGGRLAVAVSDAGGLGLIGGGYGDHAWLREELDTAKAETTRPWGVGLITWRTDRETVELALSYEPEAFLLSFGDPRAFAPTIKEAGCKLICQVQDIEGAILAKEAGADVIVAQGGEAGGHGTERYGTLPLVPVVADLVSPTPVLAAGGIADGRGLAAALMLGAQGVMMGTRFYASMEALGHQRAKQRLVTAKGSETKRTRIFDVVRGYPWPQPYTGRAIRNRFMERWEGREDELATMLDTEGQALQEAIRQGDTEIAMVWAGEAVDLVFDIAPAGALVRRIVAEAERCLRHESPT